MLKSHLSKVVKATFEFFPRFAPLGKLREGSDLQSL